MDDEPRPWCSKMWPEAKNIEGWQRLVMGYRQSSVGKISETFGISSGIVNLILDDNQQLHEEEETESVDQG